VVNLEIIDIGIEKVDLVLNFLENAGQSLDTFRYFNSRNVEIIKHHMTTKIVKLNQSVIGYGHLEEENGKVWLGISMTESHSGRGYGKILLSHLIEHAVKLSINNIYLTVDKKNNFAIEFYNKAGFKKIEDISEKVILMSLKL
jgi:RimJ/RimL family protein N-acetyltransferase